MDILYNKKIACAVTALMIAFSIFGLGGNKLNDMYKSAEEVFFYGSSENAVFSEENSVNQYITNIFGQASNVLVIGEKYIDKTKEQQEREEIEKTYGDDGKININDIYIPYSDIISDLKDSVEDFKTADSMEGKILCYNYVMFELQDLEERFDQMIVKEDDSNYLISLYSEIDANRQKIRNDVFNKYWDEYRGGFDGAYTEFIAETRGLGLRPKLLQTTGSRLDMELFGF